MSTKSSKISRREFLKIAGVGATAAAATGVLAACSPAATPTAAPQPTAAPAQPQPTKVPSTADISGELNVWSWADKPNLRDTAALFNQKYPDVKFNFTSMTWQDTHQKLAVALAAGSGAPDVVSLDGAQMQNFVDIGGLLDITTAMSAFVKDFPAYKIREVSDAAGKMYAVPWDIGPVSLFYRKDIFEKYGVTPPTTWADYITIGQKMAKDGVFMLAFSLTTPNPQDVSTFQKLLWQAGGSYFDKASGAVILDNDAGKKAINQYADIIFAGITLDVAPWTPAQFGAWKDGKIVTDIGAGWMGHVFPDNIKEGEGSYGQWRVADQMPAIEAGGTPTSNLGGSNIAATAQSKNPSAAVAYCLFTCASVDGQSLMGAKGTFPGYLPALADTRTKDAQFPVYGDQKFNQPWIALAPKTPTTYWRDKAFPQADVIVNAGLPNIYTKKWKPEEGLKAIADNLRAATLRP